MATQNSIDTNKPIEVSKGGSGASTLTDGGILLGSGTGAITALAQATDGQIPIGSTGNDAILATITGGANIGITNTAGSIIVDVNGTTDHAVQIGNAAGSLASLAVAADGELLIGSTGADCVPAALASASGTISYTAGAGTLDLSVGGALLTPSGFESWGGAGNYYDDTTLGQFTVLRAGTGYIKGVPISWASPQTETGLTAGNTYFIYIDNTGTIGSTTTYNDALFRDNIVLFEVLRDSTAGTNIQVTVKENHSYEMPWKTSVWAHDTIGSVISNMLGGANITLNGTQKIEISGVDSLEDHGLDTTIPDSGGTAEVFEQYFTLGSGKWARHAQSDTFDGTWNNAGTATAIGANKFTINRLYVSKDDITTATPTYFSVMGDAQYNNLAAAQTAIANDSIPTATGELAVLELAHLGYIIFKQSTVSIVEVIISKETARTSFAGVTATTASLVLTDVTNFDGILSAADTTSQAAFETIDDWGKTASRSFSTDSGSAVPSSEVITIQGGANIDTAGSGSTVTVSLDASISGMTAVDFATGGRLGTATGAGNTALIQAYDVDGTAYVTFATLTANNTPTMDLDDAVTKASNYIYRAAGTDVPVTDGGTGVSSLTDHGVLVGSGATAITVLAVGATNEVLLGATGADPTWGAVPNAALANSAVTLSNGNNITITGSPLSLGGTATVNVSGTTQYALQVGDATGSLDSLAVGTATQMMQSGGAGANPAWSTATYPATTAQGDVIYSSAANTVAGLTKDATATRYLANTGASNNPAWDQVELTNGVSGTLPVGNGGSGAATFTDHGLLVGSVAAAFTALAVGATNQVLLGATGADPVWGAVDLTTDITGILPVGNGGTGVNTITDHAVMVGSAAAAVTPLAAAGNGELIIGSVGADPAVTTLTEGANITITNGAGTITIAAAGGGGGGITWNVITADLDPMVVDNGYICNKAGLLTVTLPTTAAVGTVQRVTGMNTDLGWKIEQSANQIIHFGDASTTTGAGGSLASTLKRDSVELVCVVADLEWNVISATGNITIV